MTSATSQTLTTTSVEQLKALHQELTDKKAAVKAAHELTAWEQKTAARNPAYVVGSVRKATEADTAILGHVHGLVCEIRCQTCGKLRVINKQDAFQVRYCADCRKKAGREASKEKRFTKKLAGVSKQDLERQIAELSALLAGKDEPKAKKVRKAKKARKAKVVVVSEVTEQVTEQVTEPVIG